MSKYKIWNGTDEIIVPTGKVFSPEEWRVQHPWTRKSNAKIVIADSFFNGGFLMELTQMKSIYEKQGCEFTSNMTDEEILTVIEEFEDRVIEEEPTVEERMVALEEYKAMVDVEGYVPSNEIVEKNFSRGLWTESMLTQAVTKGAITSTEKSKMVGNKNGGVIGGKS